MEARRSEARDFSLVLGGPLYQLLRRAHLSGDALTLLRRRILAFTLVTWAPLLALSVFEGRAEGAGVAVPFLRDVDVHAKFLIALPLLILAELVVHMRLRPLVAQFLDQELVPPSAASAFEAAIRSAVRIRNSVAVEAVLMALVYAVGVRLIWRHFLALDAPTWYATPSAGGSDLSLAGTWYGLVSLPIYQFLLCRWLFRLFIWTRFLGQVSRLDLNLVPTHPDRAGGLGFLSTALFAFVPLAAAFGVMLTGTLANRIFHSGAKLTDFKLQIALGVLFVIALFAGPFLVFAPKLARLKRRGVLEYGALAQRYVSAFDAKWLRGGAAASEPLVGSADIQSLADLGNGFEVIRSMRSAPIAGPDVARLAVATLLPIVPLVLTVMPLRELLKLVLGLLH